MNGATGKLSNRHTSRFLAEILAHRLMVSPYPLRNSFEAESLGTELSPAENLVVGRYSYS